MTPARPLLLLSLGLLALLWGAPSSARAEPSGAASLARQLGELSSQTIACSLAPESRLAPAIGLQMGAALMLSTGPADTVATLAAFESGRSGARSAHAALSLSERSERCALSKLNWRAIDVRSGPLSPESLDDLLSLAADSGSLHGGILACHSARPTPDSARFALLSSLQAAALLGSAGSSTRRLDELSASYGAWLRGFSAGAREPGSAESCAELSGALNQIQLALEASPAAIVNFRRARREAIRRMGQSS